MKEYVRKEKENETDEAAKDQVQDEGTGSDLACFFPFSGAPVMGNENGCRLG